jgi:hypothetical protein
MKSQYTSLAYLAGAALAAVVSSADAETAVSKDATNVVGTMNVKTGVFTPLPPVTSGDAATQGDPYDGWVIAYISAVNKSKIPASANVSCDLTWTAYDSETRISIYRYYSTRAQVTATTIRCTVKVPYTLDVTNQGATTIKLSPSLNFYDEAGKPEASVAPPGTEFPLPPPGRTTTRSFSTVL